MGFDVVWLLLEWTFRETLPQSSERKDTGLGTLSVDDDVRTSLILPP
jgi:hypothetical protein